MAVFCIGAARYFEAVGFVRCVDDGIAVCIGCTLVFSGDVVDVDGHFGVDAVRAGGGDGAGVAGRIGGGDAAVHHFVAIGGQVAAFHLYGEVAVGGHFGGVAGAVHHDGYHVACVEFAAHFAAYGHFCCAGFGTVDYVVTGHAGDHEFGGALVRRGDVGGAGNIHVGGGVAGFVAHGGAEAVDFAVCNPT